MDIQQLFEKNYIRDLIMRVCGDITETITRPACYMVRNLHEGDHDMRRIIILPPRGYTADKINQTNSHDEAEYATIEIKGAVRSDKNSFSVLKNCMLVASIPLSKSTSELNKPYMLYDIAQPEKDVELAVHSSGTAPFAVVKSDGYGFYHNLVNLTDDWLVLELYKKLRPQKQVNLEPHLSALLTGEANALEKLYASVVEHGDAIFGKSRNLIDLVVKMPVDHTLPALTDMLFTHDTGKHEACSVFAVILKIGKMHPERVASFLQQAIQTGSVPTYYAEQLIAKIDANSKAVLRQAV